MSYYVITILVIILMKTPGVHVNPFDSIPARVRRLAFLGSFTVGAEVAVEAGRLKILREGAPKFVPQVEHLTFSGPYAVQRKQEARSW